MILFSGHLGPTRDADESPDPEQQIVETPKEVDKAEPAGGAAAGVAEQPIPPPWELVVDETTGHQYYWNIETNQVSWVHPSEIGEDTVVEDGIPVGEQAVDDDKKVTFIEGDDAAAASSSHEAAEHDGVDGDGSQEASGSSAQEDLSKEVEEGAASGDKGENKTAESVEVEVEPSEPPIAEVEEVVAEEETERDPQSPNDSGIDKSKRAEREQSASLRSSASFASAKSDVNDESSSNLNVTYEDCTGQAPADEARAELEAKTTQSPAKVWHDGNNSEEDDPIETVTAENFSAAASGSGQQVVLDKFEKEVDGVCKVFNTSIDKVSWAEQGKADSDLARSPSPKKDDESTSPKKDDVSVENTDENVAEENDEAGSNSPKSVSPVLSPKTTSPKSSPSTEKPKSSSPKKNAGVISAAAVITKKPVLKS